MYTALNRNSSWPEVLFSPAKGNICHLLNTVGLLRDVSAVTESLLNLPAKKRTFQRDEEESIFMSLSLLCDWTKWVFSVFHCCQWRLYGNAIHTFFPADLFGRSKEPHLSVWAHPRDLASSLTGVLARPHVTAARDGSLASSGLLWSLLTLLSLLNHYTDPCQHQKYWTELN